MKLAEYIEKPSDKEVILFSYFRSSTAWRMRTLMNLKKIDYDLVFVNLLKGEQSSPEYLSINPSGQLPTLKIDGELF